MFVNVTDGYHLKPMNYKAIIIVFVIFQLAACGGTGNTSGGDGGNRAPTADAGGDRDIAVDTLVTLDGSGSSDPDTDALSYRWTLFSKPANSNASLIDSNRVTPSFTTDVAGDYVIQLIVNDGSADSLVDFVTVTASSQGTGSSGNRLPDADAGIDRVVTVDTLVTLDGSRSSDPDADTLSYQWSFLSKPATSNAILAAPDQVNPSFTADVVGNYVVQLIVNDGTADSLADAMTITVSSQNIRPIAIAGEDTIIKFGTSASLDGSASYDPNGDSLIYRWTIIDPDGLRTQGVFRKAVIEFTPDKMGDYILELFVRDDGAGELKDRDEVRITAASRIINLAWPANADNPAGYVVYAGSPSGLAENRVKTMVKGDGSWDPSNPGVQLGWETVLRAAGLPLSATEVCLSVRAYNGFGLSQPSLTSCFTKP